MGWFRSTPSEGDGLPSVEDRLAGIGPGIPGRCPSCDGLGYIDSIDIAHRYQIQHCKDCQHRWEYLFDQDGAVVGLTELDDTGQPTARTRVRPLRASAPAVEPAPQVDLTAPLAAEADDPDLQPAATAVEVAEPVGTIEVAEDAEEVLDLRDPVVEPVVEPVPASIDEMSPAEWLRHSLRR